jgi:sulfoxide reductase heme-binding subunit YedZ
MAWSPDRAQLRAIKIFVFIAALIPLGLLLADTVQNRLGANPVEALTHRTGDWVLRFLLITLAITPVRRTLCLPWLLRLRRMLGLFTFFYAVLHFSVYMVLDQFFDAGAIVADIAKRPYITVGFTAWLMLLALAATSTQAAMRRLGGRWQKLHRLVYVAAVLGVLHFLWLVKSDIREPMLYATILAMLLGMRLYWRIRTRKPVLSPGI